MASTSMNRRAFLVRFGGAAALTAISVPLLSRPASASTTHDLTDVTVDDPGPWRFFYAPRRNTFVRDYHELAVEALPNGRWTARPDISGAPWILWTPTENDVEVKIHPAKGLDMLAGWQAPSSGTWHLSLEVTNVGMNVLGGDGGELEIAYLPPSADYDTAVLDTMRVPVSSPDPETQVADVVVEIEAGALLLIRADARIGGYGDGFVTRCEVAEISGEGLELVHRGLDGYLPLPPDEVTSYVELPPDIFLLGWGGLHGTSDYARESVELVQRYVPRLGMAFLSNYPERLPDHDFYRDLGVPIMNQSHGKTGFERRGFEPFYWETGAYELDWKSGNIGAPDGEWPPINQATHTTAMPHPAYRRALDLVARSSIRSGHAAYAFGDFVWTHRGGRGASGYHEETVRAFREDLQGNDEGLAVTLNGQGRTVLHFAEYAAHYFGGLPSPTDLGFSSWAEYQPITYEQYNEHRDPPQDATTGAGGSAVFDSAFSQYLILHDLLCSYEWAKTAQAVGRSARAEGGKAGLMPHPEDLANGSDYLFLVGLHDVSYAMTEYFNDPIFLDGAYHHLPYLRRHARGDQSPGIVVETGHGGHGEPYYATEVSYAVAYEIMAATDVRHLESDFWGAQGPLDEETQNPTKVRRMQGALAYGLGYTDARTDQPERLPADVIAVSDRAIFRPGGLTFDPWIRHLRRDHSPEGALAAAGFLFDGIGQEATGDINDVQPTLLYHPDHPTEKSWTAVVNRLVDGTFETVVGVAGSLQTLTSTDLRQRPLSEVTPSIALDPADDTASGALLRGGTEHGTFDVAGVLYAPPADAAVEMTVGGVPVLATLSLGRGALHVVLFDPSLEDNDELTATVYSLLLAEADITSHWQQVEGKPAIRLYRDRTRRMTIVGVQHAKARRRVDDFVPYAIPDTTTLRVRMDADTTYAWAAMPSGASGEVTADGDGWVELGFTGTSHEVFYLLPEGPRLNQHRIAKILDRRTTFEEAMTIGGRVSTSG